MTELMELFSMAPKAIELENGKTAHLRRMSAADRLIWIELLSRDREQKRDITKAYSAQAALLALTICDEKGVRRFDFNPADKEATEATLQQLQTVIDEVIFNQLAAEAFRLNGIDAQSREEIKKKQQAQKPGSSEPSPQRSKRR